jgi:fucose 4-O-acetylase-like acetyltransferase
MDLNLSLKMRRLAFFCTLTIVWVHSFNLDNRYLWPGYNLFDNINLNAAIQLLLCNGFFRFAIPLFFTISGYLMAEREGKLTYGKMVGKRAKMLLGPYFAWGAIGLLFTYVWESSNTLRQFVDSSNLRPFDDKNLHDFTIWEWLEAWTITPVSFQLWFLRSLFIYSVIYPALAWAIERKPLVYFIVAGLLWLVSGDLMLVGGDGLLYFGLGIFLRKKNIDTFQLPKIFYSIYFLILAFSLPVLHTFFAFSNPAWAIEVGYFTFKMMQPLLLVAVWVVYDKWISSREPHFFDQLSTTNFFIYGAHVPAVYFITDWLFSHFGKDDETRLVIFLALPATVILISITLGLTLKKFWPAAFGLLSGWRKFNLKAGS